MLSTGRAVGVLARVDDLDAGMAALAAAGLVARREDDALVVEVAPTEASLVTQALAKKKLWVTELRPLEASLEDVFLQLTEEGQV